MFIWSYWQTVFTSIGRVPTKVSHITVMDQRYQLKQYLSFNLLTVSYFTNGYRTISAGRNS